MSQQHRINVCLLHRVTWYIQYITTCFNVVKYRCVEAIVPVWITTFWTELFLCQHSNISGGMQNAIVKSTLNGDSLNRWMHSWAPTAFNAWVLSTVIWTYNGKRGGENVSITSKLLKLLCFGFHAAPRRSMSARVENYIAEILVIFRISTAVFAAPRSTVKFSTFMSTERFRSLSRTNLSYKFPLTLTANLLDPCASINSL